MLVDKFNTKLKNFLEEYPDSFTKLSSGAVLFHDFKVTVTASFGELKLTKGSTDESSSEEIANVSEEEKKNEEEVPKIPADA